MQHHMYRSIVVYPFAKILILSESQLAEDIADGGCRCLSICKDTNFKRITTDSMGGNSESGLFIHLQRY